MNDRELSIVKPDRGTVKRMTLEVLYPNGQLKQVQIENNSGADWGTISMIVFDDHAIETVLHEAKQRSEINSLWTTKDGEGEYPPAMLVMSTDGRLTPFCGRHKQLTPPHERIL